MCRPDDYPPHDDPERPELAALRDRLHARRARAQARHADRYAEALAGARAMRDNARPWADHTDDPTIPAGAGADERRYGIPPWPAVDTE